MWLATRCDLAFDIAVPTPFILMLRPRSGAQQWVAQESYELSPSVLAAEFTDGYGNLCQRLTAQPGHFSIHTSAQVRTSDLMDRDPSAGFVDIQLLPDAVLEFLLPSRYCDSDRFNQMALEIVEGRYMGIDSVVAVEEWLRENIRFAPGESVVPVSAVEVNQRGWGVCRDLAHLGIALCRSISIPARLVVGYLEGLEPMDLHAWFEAYVGGRWYSFDATQPSLRGGYVALGYGRDAADVAVYNQFGPAVFPLEQRVEVSRIRNRDG
ncbi:MAG TPA: transglutaminase family protein [Pseudomonadales bacterium]|nr:transglutaminase family protein [Pseudomonadales bacterium]